MNVVNISEKKFKSLERFDLPDNVLNSESELFYFDEKNKWEKNRLLFKKLNNDFGIIFSNKLFTVNELINNRNIIDIDELVFPDKLVSIHGKITGFTMPLINSVNFDEILYSDEFSNREKIGYLKEIGLILEKMNRVRKYTKVNDFYLNDIHEANFILNKDTNRINVVDLDSAKINGNMTMTSLRLSPFSNIYSVSKYDKENSICGGCYKPSYNTELYCYIMIILRFISNYRINNLDSISFYDYMEYLSDVGINKELLDIFSNVYSEKNNINPYMLLDELENNINKCEYPIKLLRK